METKIRCVGGALLVWYVALGLAHIIVPLVFWMDSGDQETGYRYAPALMISSGILLPFIGMFLERGFVLANQIIVMKADVQSRMGVHHSLIEWLRISLISFGLSVLGIQIALTKYVYEGMDVQAPFTVAAMVCVWLFWTPLLVFTGFLVMTGLFKGIYFGVLHLYAPDMEETPKSNVTLRILGAALLCVCLTLAALEFTAATVYWENEDNSPCGGLGGRSNPHYIQSLIIAAGIVTTVFGVLFERVVSLAPHKSLENCAALHGLVLAFVLLGLHIPMLVHALPAVYICDRLMTLPMIVLLLSFTTMTIIVSFFVVLLYHRCYEPANEEFQRLLTNP